MAHVRLAGHPKLTR